MKNTQKNKQKMWRALKAKNIGDPAKGIPGVLSRRQQLHRQRYQIDGSLPSALLGKLISPWVERGSVLADDVQKQEDFYERMAKRVGTTLEEARWFFRVKKAEAHA